MSQKFNPNSQSLSNKEKNHSFLVSDKEQKPKNQEIQQNLLTDAVNQKPQQNKQLSQTFSQCPQDADDKIMQNLNKNEQKRYSNLLKSMGIQLKSGQKQKKQTSNPQDERGSKKFLIVDSIRKSEANDLDTMNAQVSSVQDKKQIQSNNSIQYGQVSFDVDNLYQANNVTNEPMMRSQSVNNQQVRPNQPIQNLMRQSQNLSNRRAQNYQQGQLQATNYTSRTLPTQIDNGMARTNSFSNPLGVGFSQNIQPRQSQQTTRYSQSLIITFQKINRFYPVPEMRLANSIHSQANIIPSQKIDNYNDQMNNRRSSSANLHQSQSKQLQNDVKIEIDQLKNEHISFDFSKNNVYQNGQTRQEVTQQPLNNSQKYHHIDQNPSFNVQQPKDVQIDGPNFPSNNQVKDIQIDGDNNHNITSKFQNAEIITSKEDCQPQFQSNLIQASKDIQIDGNPQIFQTKNQSQTSINRINLSSQNFKQSQSIANSQAQKIELQQNNYNSKQNIPQLSQRLSNQNSIINQSQKSQQSQRSTHQILQNQSQHLSNKNSQFHPNLQIQQNIQIKITGEQPYNEKMEIQTDQMPAINQNKNNQEKIITQYNEARPHVNSFSSSFRNSQHYYNLNNQNKQKKQKIVPRKFSQNFNSNNGFNSVLSRQSAQVKHLAQVKSQISSQRKSQIQKNCNLFGNSLGNDQQNNLNVNQSLQIEQNLPKQTQQVNNCFSNRSQKSNNSNTSNKSSSYRYNRFVDTMQVPQLTSLQIVKSHDGKESRVQRRSSRNSRNSRSASTCRKSYDELSQLYMQPIDQKPYEQLDDKSVKKTKTQTRSFNQANYLNQQFQQNVFQQNQGNTQEKKNPLQNASSKTKNLQNGLISIKSQSLHQQLQKQENQLQKKSSKMTSSLMINSQNDKLEIQSNPNDHIQENKSEYNQLRKINSKLMKNPKQQQNDRIPMEDKKRRLSLISKPLDYQISGEKAQIKSKTVPQQVDQVIQKCLQFLDKTHQLSQFQMEQYFFLISNYFNVRGINIDPINQVGVILFHDGIFVSSFIKFIKKNRNNSTVLESVIYINFKEQIGISTNQDYFMRNYEKIMQQRHNYQESQYQNRLKKQEQKRMILQEKQRQEKKAIQQYEAQKAQNLRKQEELKLKMKRIELQKQEKEKMQALKKQNNKIQQKLKQIQKRQAELRQKQQEKQKMQAQKKQNNKIQQKLKQIQRRQAQLRQKQRILYLFQDNDSSETATINQKRTEPAQNVIKLIKRTSIAHNIPKSQKNNQIQDNDNMTASITTRNPFQDFPAVNSKKQQNVQKKRITKKKDRKINQNSRPIQQLSTQNDQMMETLSKTRSKKIQVQSNGQQEVKATIKSQQKDISSKNQEKTQKSQQKQNKSKQKQNPSKSKQKRQGKGILKESKPTNKFVGKTNKEIKNLQPVRSNRASPKQQKRQYSPIQQIQSKSKSKSSKISVSQNPNTVQNTSLQEQINGRRVKFTQSTKGGSKSHQKKIYRKTGVVDNKEQTINQPKKRLRSRSKSKK